MGKKLAGRTPDKGQQKRAARRRRDFIAGGIVAAALVAVVTVVLLLSGGAPRRTAEGLLADGSEAPGFTLARLGGGASVSLGDHTGRVVVLNFWHSQ